MNFGGSKYLFQLNLVCIGDSRIGFCPAFFWKQVLNLRGSHCSCSMKKRVFRNFVNFTGKHLYWSLFLNKVAGQETQAQMFSCWVYEIFKNWSLRTTSSETCCFTWSVFPNKLHLWFWLVHGFCIIIYNSPFITNTIDIAIHSFLYKNQ